jgi:peptidoglycan/xylan/chitin deacetylase (PgdA/CDA1 family)
MALHTSSVAWVPILVFHRIVDDIPPDDRFRVCTTRRRFERQMQWFARLGWRTLSLEDAGARLIRRERIPPRHFVITFDDGYEDTLTAAAPILHDLGFTATVFVVTGLIGQRSSWDDGQPWEARLMSWDQLKVWLKMGFSIGSHTVSHVRLSQIPLDAARYELTESRRSLEAQLGISVRTLCYPHGERSDAVCELAAEAGYDVACGFGDIGPQEHGRYTLARIDSASWHPPMLTSLVRCHPWYFALTDSRVLRALRHVIRLVQRCLDRHQGMPSSISFKKLRA